MSSVRFEYEPLPIFANFHRSAERTRLIVGGYGSGKSHALCAEAIALGLEQPGSEFLVMRKTVPALKTTTEKIFLSLLPPEFFDQCGVSRSGGHLDYIIFPNGSMYYFRGCADWKRHRSMNLSFIVWDEADEFTTEDFDGLQSRLRQSVPTPQARELGHKRTPRNGNIMACNPQGRNWIWEYFVDEGNARHRENSAYWVSTSFDNPYLPKATLTEWLAMPDPWVRRYVLSSFDEFAGAIYEGWQHKTHVVRPFKDAAGNYKYDPSSFFRMGFDPGTSSGNAALWVYYDKATNRLVGVAEYNETGLSATAHAKAWRRIEAQHGMRVQTRIADPKAVTQRDRGSTHRLSDQYRRLGFHFSLGPGGVDDRVWSLGELIAQGRFVVTDECPNTYAQILNYRWEDLTPTQVENGRESRPLKKDVDLVDAAQYAVSRYVPPPKVQAAPIDPEEQNSREIHAAIRRQLQRGRSENARPANDIGMFA
jgi:PBSX family phage terminase large subunit